MSRHHSIICQLDCEWCEDCWCHDESGEGGRAYGRMGAAHEAAPGTVLVTPTEGLATTPTGRPTS